MSGIHEESCRKAERRPLGAAQAGLLDAGGGNLDES